MNTISIKERAAHKERLAELARMTERYKAHNDELAVKLTDFPPSKDPVMQKIITEL